MGKLRCPFISSPDLDVPDPGKVPVMSWQSCMIAAKYRPGSSAEAPVYSARLTGQLSVGHGPGLLSAVPPAKAPLSDSESFLLLRRESYRTGHVDDDIGRGLRTE